jgi:uncharacterized membrane protein
MKSSERLLLPDIWRGTALLGMILLHAIFIGWLLFEKSMPFQIQSDVGRVLSNIIGGSFLAVAGWSAWLKWNSHPEQALALALKKVGLIFAWAIVITLVTILAFPSAAIWWGVLHCLAAALFVAHIFLSRKMFPQLVWLGVITLLIGIFRQFIPGSLITIPLGFPPANFATLDYYPLFPYAGVVWITAGMGKLITAQLGKYEQPLSQNWPGKKLLLWLGQHSLLVYITHVPILIAVFWVLSLI